MPIKRRKKGYSAYLLDWGSDKELSDEEAMVLCKNHNLKDVETLKEDFADIAKIYRNNKNWNSGPTQVVIRDTAQAIAKHAAALADELDELDGATNNAIRRLNTNQLEGDNSVDEINFLIRRGILQKIINVEGEAELDVTLLYIGVKLLANQAQGTVNHLNATFKKNGSKMPKRSYKSPQELMVLAINWRSFWNKQTGKDITCGFDDMDEYGEPAIIPKSASAMFFVDIIKLMIPTISTSQVRELMKDCKKTFDKDGKYRTE